MRKSFLLVLLALVISVGSISFAGVSIYKERDNVTYEENILYGDRSIANGLSITHKTHLKEQLFWKTNLSFSENLNIESDYQFYAQSQSPEYEWESYGVSLSVSFDHFDISDSNPIGLDVAYKELFDSIEPGEEAEKTVYLKDYLEYYDFQVMFDLSNWGIYSGGSTYEAKRFMSMNESDVNMKAVYDMSQYFKIPVLEHETYAIRVGKHANGHLATMGGGQTFSENFHMITYSAFTDNATYFTFDPYGSEGTLVDLSELPEGYGIFCLPHDTVTENDFTYDAVRTDKLSMVYPLDPTSKLFSLDMSEDQTCLFLYTIENEQLILKIIDIASMELKQELIIIDSYHQNNLTIHQQDDFLTLFDYSNETLRLFALNKANDYEHKFTCKFYPDNSIKDHMFNEVLYYNGSQLACIGTTYSNSRLHTDFTSLSVMIYDETGLTFAADYLCSLDSGCDREIYDYPCESVYNDSLTVSWQ